MVIAAERILREVRQEQNAAAVAGWVVLVAEPRRREMEWWLIERGSRDAPCLSCNRDVAWSDELVCPPCGAR